MKSPWMAETFSRQKSLIHRQRFGVKAAMALTLLLLLAWGPRSWWLIGALSVVLLGLTTLARLPLGYLSLRIICLEPLFAGMALLRLFEPHGWHAAAWILARCTLSLWTMLWFSHITPFTHLLEGLERVGMPRLLLTTLTLMYRYLGVLGDEAMRMERGRQSRSFVLSRRRRWWLQATVISQLFVRTTARAERIYAAMLARGFSPDRKK